MDLLLDTHAFIWYVEDNRKLPKTLRKVIEEKDNDLYISIATFWEMAIKIQLGKLTLTKDLETIIVDAELLGFLTLPIQTSHIIKLQGFKLHHRDPFDRILAAQALSEKMHLVSADDIFDSYKVKRVW